LEAALVFAAVEQAWLTLASSLSFSLSFRSHLGVAAGAQWNALFAWFGYWQQPWLVVPAVLPRAWPMS
jgi:hypothetical protein